MSARDDVPLRAIVTGGSSGIGLATLLRFAEAGGGAVSLDLVEPLQAALPWVRVDVADDASVRAGVEQAVTLLGGLDVLVNNAGVEAVGTVEDYDGEQWRRVLDVNVVGMARVAQACLPHLRRSAAASIVNVCSIAATAGLPQRALYSASKGAVLGLTRAMAADCMADGIRVNCVSPGTADTPWVERLLARAEDPDAERAALARRQPTGRFVSAEEVAAAIGYLAGPAAGSTTGAELPVDGGMSGLRLSPRS